MLNDLKKMINAEAESDLIVDMMLEAATNSIADMFIEDDGEIEMAEEEILNVLDKIPAYDEEAEMNKKLAKIAENYIPEDLTYVYEAAGFKRIINKLMRAVRHDHYRRQLALLIEEFNQWRDEWQNILDTREITKKQGEELKRNALEAAKEGREFAKNDDWEERKRIMIDQCEWLENYAKAVDVKLRGQW